MHPLLSPRHWLFPLVLFGIVVTAHILWPGFSDEGGEFDCTVLSIIVLNAVLLALSPRVVIARIVLLLQCMVTLLFMYLRLFTTDSGSCSGRLSLRFSFLHSLIPLAQSLGIHQGLINEIFSVMCVSVMILEPIVVGVSLYDCYMWYRSRALPA
jgi:hypothetical protein